MKMPLGITQYYEKLQFSSLNQSEGKIVLPKKW